MDQTGFQKGPFIQVSEFLGNHYRKINELMGGHKEIILDASGTVLTWDRQFRKYSGFSDHEAIGKKIQCLFPQIRDNAVSPNLTPGSYRLDSSDCESGIRKLKIQEIKKNKRLLGYTVLLL